MTRIVRLFVAFLAMVLVGTTFVGPPASAAPTWQPVTDLSAIGGTADAPQVAGGPDGTATAIWYRFSGAENIIQSASRAPGGTWSVPVDLSATGQDAYTPQVTVGSDGTATAIWSRSNGTHAIIQSATRPLGGAWSAPVNLSAAGQSASVSQVAVGTDGGATAVWARFDGANFVIQSATRPAGGGAWSAPVNLSAAGQYAYAPQVVVDAAGNATAVWHRSNGTNFVIQSATRPAGGTWAAATNLSAADNTSSDPQVVVDAAGNATAVWGHYNGAHYIVQSATRPAGGIWTSLRDLSAVGQDAFAWQVGVDPTGTATAVWTRSNGTNQIVQSATRVAGTWTAPVGISAAGQDASAPQVVVDAAGSATAVWYRYDGTTQVVQSAARPAGGTWTTPIDLSAAGQTADIPQVAIDPDGNATAVWPRSDGGTKIVQARGLDKAGPKVTSLTAPATGTTGQALAYAVTASDTWSTVAGVTWDFGDGTTATGTSVSHTFAAAGARTVTVTLTDAVGNATTRTAPTTITAAVPPATTPPVTTPPATTPPATSPAISQATLKPKVIRGTKKAKLTVVLTTAASATLVFKKKGAKALTVRKTFKAGKNTYTFGAKLARKKILRPGRYTLTLTATNSAGTSPATKLKLRVVR